MVVNNLFIYSYVCRANVCLYDEVTMMGHISLLISSHCICWYINCWFSFEDIFFQFHLFFVINILAMNCFASVFLYAWHCLNSVSTLSCCNFNILLLVLINFGTTLEIWLYCIIFYCDVSGLPSVLWHCWLGGRKGIRPVKNWAVGCWRGYLSGARCRLAYGPADATATHCLLLQ